MDHRKLHHRQITQRQLFVARRHSAAFLEVAHDTLDDVALPVGHAVEGALPRLGRLVGMVRDDRLHAQDLEHAPDGFPGVGRIAGDLAGDEPGLRPGVGQGYRSEGIFEVPGFVILARTRGGSEGSSVTANDQVELRPKPASRATQCVVRGLCGSPLLPAPAALREARTVLPSTHHRSQSIRPFSSKRTSRRSSTRSQVPSILHLRKWSYAVDQGPYASRGRSRHWAPVCRIQKHALIIRRGSAGCRPRGLGLGNNSSISFHCRLSTSYRRMNHLQTLPNGGARRSATSYRFSYGT